MTTEGITIVILLLLLIVAGIVIAFLYGSNKANEEDLKDISEKYKKLADEYLELSAYSTRTMRCIPGIMVQHRESVEAYHALVKMWSEKHNPKG